MQPITRTERLVAELTFKYHNLAYALRMGQRLPHDDEFKRNQQLSVIYLRRARKAREKADPHTSRMIGARRANQLEAAQRHAMLSSIYEYEAALYDVLERQLYTSQVIEDQLASTSEPLEDWREYNISLRQSGLDDAEKYLESIRRRLESYGGDPVAVRERILG